MKREDLTKLGLTDEALIDQIMKLHGSDVEKHKTAAETLKTEADGLKTQLTEAGKTIESFKKLDVDGIKAAADDYKAKFEQAQQDATTQLAALKFDHALEGALTSAKARNLKAVRALLKTEDLKLAEDGTIVGLKDQLEKVKSENDFLFEGDGKLIKIVAGGNNQQVIGDAVVMAARKAAGLVDPK